MRVCFATFVVGMLVSVSADAGSLKKAKLYYEHKLLTEAKKEAIDTVFDPAEPDDVPGALALLGEIAIGEGNYKAAASAWARLKSEYPGHAEAKRVAELLPKLSEAINKATEENVDNLVARRYLKSADFWADGRDKVFRIDSSWLPHVASAIYWNDRVIKEFPGTDAARVAYEHKLLTILGWETGGRYSTAHGLKKDFDKWMPVLIKSFRAFEAAFPRAASLQAFRFQIAQAHWGKKKWEPAEKWLREIVAKDKGANGFYKDLAERRLKKLKW